MISGFKQMTLDIKQYKLPQNYNHSTQDTLHSSKKYLTYILCGQLNTTRIVLSNLNITPHSCRSQRFPPTRKKIT